MTTRAAVTVLVLKAGSHAIELHADVHHLQALVILYSSTVSREFHCQFTARNFVMLPAHGHSMHQRCAKFSANVDETALESTGHLQHALPSGTTTALYTP